MNLKYHLIICRTKWNITYGSSVRPKNRHSHSQRHRPICLGCSGQCYDIWTDRDDNLQQ